MYKALLKDKDIAASYLKNDYKLDFISTGIISMNVLFSGRVTGGIPVGKISQMAAPSTLGKSFIGLSCLKNAQRKGMKCFVLDTEFAFDFNFAEAIGIDVSEDKLCVIQNNRIEQVQKMTLNILDAVEDKAERANHFFLLDSYGAMVTSKSVDDALSGNDKADMTEAKKKNKFAKLMMGTGGTFFIVNHVLDNIGGFGDPLGIPGGRGLFFVSSCIVLGSSKAKDKDSGDISGAIVTCMTKKSRFSKEHTKIKFRINHDGGLDIWYGLLDQAVEGGFVQQANGFVKRPHIEDDKKVREKTIYNAEFWKPIFQETDFKNFLEDKYTFRASQMDISSDDIIEDL